MTKQERDAHLARVEAKMARGERLTPEDTGPLTERVLKICQPHDPGDDTRVTLTVFGLAAMLFISCAVYLGETALGAFGALRIGEGMVYMSFGIIFGLVGVAAVWGMVKTWRGDL